MEDAAMAIRKELLDELLKEVDNPEELFGKDGLLKGRAVGESLLRPARRPRLPPRFSSREDGPVNLPFALLPFVPLRFFGAKP